MSMSEKYAAVTYAIFEACKRFEELAQARMENHDSRVEYLESAGEEFNPEDEVAVYNAAVSCLRDETEVLSRYFKFDMSEFIKRTYEGES